MAQETRDSIKDIWGPRTPYRNNWPVRVDQRCSEEPDKWVQSACVLCSNGCGMDIGVKDGRIVGVRGREVDRVNHGRLGPKGLHAWEANESADRLTHPLVRKNGKLVKVSWDEAMNLIVEKSQQFIKESTEHSIAFYTSGQLFLEEYYTLAVIGKAGIGSPHMDGNTRLCTATAAAAMRESFGCDGQPGSYTDIDTTECIFLSGHNMANTQTVLWARILDRLEGPCPPQLIVLDPRLTATAKKADVHLIPKPGTNVAVLNGILHLIIENNWIDKKFIENHTIGFEKLKEVVARYTPEEVEKITGVKVESLRKAAQIIGTTKSLLSTVLQGVYQSNQATAAACQVNNINLVRGLIGKPGSGIYQMNGQPTAQNNREAGCNGEFTGFRNFENKQHMQDLANHWNVEVEKIPHAHTPTHIMSMLSMIEAGSIRMLWISGTNPAVSLPELARVRRLLQKNEFFLVVQDGFPTETTELADVVLPSAIWGEKTGTFTNVDRTVHISYKAIEPPGEARSDMDIWLDYADRMKMKDKDGQPLLKWKNPEEAFDHWKDSTRNRPCDYTGMSYAKLTGGSGVQWPCNEENPTGKERLYTDFQFPTDLNHCESFGHDLETGAAYTREDYSRTNPNGRAIFKPADYRAPEEAPDNDYPFWVTTGRLVYHFHTRTKTGRSKELQNAAPEAFVQISVQDADLLKIRDGDLVAVTSRRGCVEVPAQVGDIEQGQVFIPFHYGYWDAKDQRSTAANELTMTGWDPVSKQPYFKFGAVKLEKLSKTKLQAKELLATTREKAEVLKQDLISSAKNLKPKHQHLSNYLGLLTAECSQLKEVYETLGQHYASHFEIKNGLRILTTLVGQIEDSVQPFSLKYEMIPMDSTVKRIREGLFPHSQTEAFGLLRDLQSIYVFVAELTATIHIVLQGARAAKDKEFSDTMEKALEILRRNSEWAMTQMKSRSTQTLIVPS